MASSSALQVDLGDESPRTATQQIGFQRRRSQIVFLREDNEIHAMDIKSRLKTRAYNFVRRICFCNRGDAAYRDTKKLDAMFGTDAADDEVDLYAPDVADGRRMKQYRLEAKHLAKISRRQRILSIVTCCFIGPSNEFGLSSGFQMISSWMHWIFRIHLMFAFFCMCVAYYFIAIVFAGLIVTAGVLNKECIRVGGNEFGTFGARFFDAFCLSWTTLGTVGYGSVYPALSNQTGDRTNCTYIVALSSFEVLVGILYTGFCGAVLFAKVLRIRNLAMIVFSDPIVIRYGSGVEEDNFGLDHEHLLDEKDIEKAKSVCKKKHANEGNTAAAASDHEKKKEIPCPVLEFRIGNSVWDKPNGVYIDAHLNVVANVDADDVDPYLRDALDPETRWKRAISAVVKTLKRHPTSRQGSFHSETPTITTTASESTDPAYLSDHNPLSLPSETTDRSSLDSSEHPEFYDMYASVHSDPTSGHDDFDDYQDSHHRHHHWSLPLHMPRFLDHYHRHHPNQPYHPQQDHRALDEDPTSKLVTKRILSKMHLETTDHPYFQRVWLARHVLDEHSPLLTHRVRRQIRKNHGYWPESLDSFECVRQSLNFYQIVVSFQGVCNASATMTYAQKIYDFGDVNVGYRFVDMLSQDMEGNVHVDMDKINDVQEQAGGGGEPLTLHHRVS